MIKNLYYIAATHNGYVFEKVKIVEYSSINWEGLFGLLMSEEIKTKTDGLVVYGGLAGDLEQLEIFLKDGSNLRCDSQYSNSKSNTFMEDWRTDVLGYYDGVYVGLMIQ